MDFGSKFCFSLLYYRIEGGIPPLIELLESADLKVQRAVAGALRTLAFKNDENKTLVCTLIKHNKHLIFAIFSLCYSGVIIIWVH
jgi:Armadillo/beta-catenin-like repeat